MVAALVVALAVGFWILRSRNQKLAGWLRTSGSQMLLLFPAAYLANSLATSDDPTEAAVKAACKLSWNKTAVGSTVRRK